MITTRSNKAFLIILDGWGMSTNPEVSAIARAKTPTMDHLWNAYPHTTLITHGEDVGLPEGQMGNSEVGHLNIGAGRVVYQELARINKYIRDGRMHSDPVLLDALRELSQRGGAVHVMGLVSDGGVHSHTEHLKALLDAIANHGACQTYLHAFMDGRDTDPRAGIGYLRDLDSVLSRTGTQLATVIGRYYAMDRDKRWERVKLAYDLLLHKSGNEVQDIYRAVQEAYDKGVTDEFLPPMYMANSDFQGISEHDLVIFFNFRTDRPRELVYTLSQQDVPEAGMKAMPLHFLTFTRYDETFKGVKVMFEKDDLTMTLGEVVSRAGRTQLRIAETEKYPHVTFFYSGGRELPFEGESRILVNSPKVATYDLQPEMSAFEVTEQAMAFMEEHLPDLIVLNYANADMVGHTGDMNAAVAAVEAVDRCLSNIVPRALSLGYDLLIIADHGNADVMLNADGSPNTAHTTHPVPCLYISERPLTHALRSGRLADVAPTLLEILQIDQPAEMAGHSLFVG
jgi:2,3-bisphosphoglycerate-independent phosphoglycerate mutase